MSSEDLQKKEIIKEEEKKLSYSKLFFTFIKRISIILIIFICILAVGASVMIYNIIKDTDPIDPYTIENLLNESSFIYDVNGNLIEKIEGENYRIIVDSKQVPEYTKNAFIAIEDERFKEHNGVDIKRILGALLYDIKTQSKAQGASTITQQLAKNLYLTNEKTIKRKIKDMYYAFQIEKCLTKDKILEAYLNTIYLGRGATGIQAASQMYFSKNVEELNLAESALIAGITKYPTKYSGFTTEKLVGDENLDEIQLIFYPNTSKDYTVTENDMKIFGALLEKGLVDNFQFDTLRKGQVLVRKAILNPNAKTRQEVVLKKMHELDLIHTEEYEEAIKYPLKIQLKKYKIQGISSYFTDLVKKEAMVALTKKGYSLKESNNLLRNGGLRIYSTLDIRLQRILEKEYKNNKNFPGTYMDKNGNIQPQSAMVIMDYHTGEIKALVGGRMIGGNKLYNRAINPRQPGSAIKPLAVYLPALNKGMTAATVINDSPHYDKNGRLWPRNYNRKYKGPTPIRELLKWSSNVGAVKTAEKLGENHDQSIDTMISFLEQLGITTVVHREDNGKINDENFALALGGMSKGITPLQITAAYGAIANKGVYIKPILLTKIEDSNGNIIVDNIKEKNVVVSPEEAYIMTNMLEGVVRGGTGTRARLKNIAVAGKTGTTSNKNDAWFVGYTPYYVAATWIGNDLPKPLKNGSKMSATLWKNVMEKVHKDLDKAIFEKPPNVGRMYICSVTGKRATEADIEAKTFKSELFIKGTYPRAYCDGEHLKPIEPDPLDELVPNILESTHNTNSSDSQPNASEDNRINNHEDLPSNIIAPTDNVVIPSNMISPIVPEKNITNE